MVENFKNMPVSLAEKRAFDANDGKLWAPRDALIHYLRELDSGAEEIPTDIVIVYRIADKENNEKTRYITAGPSGLTTVLGMLFRVIHRMQET